MTLSSSKDGPLVALAFKLEEGRFGQLTYMRVYSGTIRKGDFVVNTSTGKRVKVRPRAVLVCREHAVHAGSLVTSWRCRCHGLAACTPATWRM